MSAAIASVDIAPHLFWLVSRAAGAAALVVSSVSVGAGLLMSMRAGGRWRPDLRPLHEALSLMTLAFVVLHVAVLLGDGWLNPSVPQLTIPFLAGGYRPLWTGLGIVSAYGLLALGLTYYARDRIGASRWRRLHRFTAAFWVLAIAHTIGSGSDAGSIWFLASCGLVVLPAMALLIERWLPREPLRDAAGTVGSGR